MSETKSNTPSTERPRNDWIGTEAGKKRFFGKIKGMGLSKEDAYEALGVESLTEHPDSLKETLDFLENWKSARDEVQAEAPQEATEVAVIDRPDISLPEWRERQDIDILGARIKAMMPGGNKLTLDQARALAQYSLAMGLNPFRGEVYGYSDSKGVFHIVDGYKSLVRWAMRQCPYTETYEPIPHLDEGAIGFRCRILRDDRIDTIKKFVDLGIDTMEAYRNISVFADGIVAASEMKGYNAPPKGWTWEQVARKRALKNTLNLSHGAPSLKEIAQESWMVGDVETDADDWEVAAEHPAEVQEDVAKLSAQTREWDLEFQSLSDEERQALFERNRDVLRGTEEERQGELL
jgi:hypothetical protein